MFPPASRDPAPDRPHAARPDAAPAYTERDLALEPLTAARLRDAVPENTRLAYRRARRSFAEWCQREGRVPLPATAATLTEYVSRLIGWGAAPATIAQHIGAIRTWHTAAGHKHQPDTEAAILLLRGYRRERAEAGITEAKAPPLLPDTLRAMIDSLDLDTLIGRRDQILLLLGINLMGRRSEMAAVALSDVRETPDGLEIGVRTSKTDRDSTGRVVAVPPASHPQLCLVTLFPRWRTQLAAHGITDGPLLRTVTRHGTPGRGLRPASINDIVKRLARRAGIPNAEAYTAHSLRAGGLTASLRHGTPLGVAAEHGGWSTRSPVVIGYARAADRWRDNAMRGVL